MLALFQKKKKRKKNIHVLKEVRMSKQQLLQNIWDIYQTITFSLLFYILVLKVKYGNN